MSEVRSGTTVPIVDDFSNSDGTPIYVDRATGIFYYLDNSGAVQRLGSAPLAGAKIYYVSDSSGGAVTRKLTFTDGILTGET